MICKIKIKKVNLKILQFFKQKLLKKKLFFFVQVIFTTGKKLMKNRKVKQIKENKLLIKEMMIMIGHLLLN